MGLRITARTSCSECGSWRLRWEAAEEHGRSIEGEDFLRRAAAWWEAPWDSILAGHVWTCAACDNAGIVF